MGSWLDEHFKFKLGAFVFFRTASHNDSQRPKRFLVTERFLEECEGGVQKFYRLNPFDGKLVPEIALASEEPEFRGPSKEYMEAVIAEDAFREAARDRRWEVRKLPPVNPAKPA